ncbi:hypothetical protein FO519_007255 [Halicephalobus sp. NKZ332]|nr:hypothetical protein FO519_007255 [Halicephalobus sp. NKZ332]
MITALLDFLNTRLLIEILIGFVLYVAWSLRTNLTKIADVLFEKLENPTIPEKHENGIVYLYQYRSCAKSPNSSPYCLKVETFLKYHKIPYLPVYSASVKSRDGLLPFIIYNGKEISDSQPIISFLEKEFNLTPKLDEKEMAIARAVERTIDNSIANAMSYILILKDPNVFFDTLLKLMPLVIAQLMFGRVYYRVKDRLEGIYFAQLPEEDIFKGLDLDLKAVNEILGDKKYLFGDEPTPADFALFGQLSIGIYCYTSVPFKTVINKYPKLEKFTENIFKDLFPHYWRNMN